MDVWADTILQDGFIVDLYTEDDPDIGFMVWGTVKLDHTHGWKCGDYACSTEVVRLVGDCFETRNSIYRFEVEPEHIRLPLTALPELRAGGRSTALAVEGSL